MHTFAAANTLGVVGRFIDLDIHIAFLMAEAAFRTLAAIDLIAVQRKAVEQAVDCSEGAKVFAKRTVEEDG